MEKFRKTIYIIFSIIAIVVVVGSLLSVLRNTEVRFLKMLDFPRIQFSIAAIFTLLLLLILTKGWKWYDFLLTMGLVAAVIIHCTYIINYTSFVQKRVATAKDNSANDQISILLTNVKESSRTAQPLLDLIETKSPDLIIAMEVDSWWDKQLKQVEKDYPYAQKSINEVAYGMALYSKFPLRAVELNYLQNRKVPSLESTVQLRKGKSFMLYCTHPVPPTHFEKLPDNAGEQEVSLIKIGKIVKASNLPSIVAGDINDVSWGNTDELTKTKNLLHDVRVGRGFYNSYNAENILMRWPLDHIYVTKEFQLISLERMPHIGSDHFPIFAKLVLKNKPSN